MSDPAKVVKEGFLKKRKARMQQWSSRYFVLTNHTLSYKLKPEAAEMRNSFDLVPGCLVTQIETETRAAIKGRKVYSFWVVWPHDKSKVKDDDPPKTTADSDDEKDPKDVAVEESKTKNLKSIVENEVWEHHKQKNIVVEQIEMHHQRDHNIGLSATVAAVTVGGVIVGAMTAGIGLLPYLAVVGVATVAGGGAVVYNWRKPFDSRIILACDTMEEAVEWRNAIEQQITKLEMAKKHSLPSSLDPRVISLLLNRASQCALWRRVGAPEGMRILENYLPCRMSKKERAVCLWRLLHCTSFAHRTLPSFLPPNYHLLLHNFDDIPGAAGAMEEACDTRCRRAQCTVQSTTINTFLSVMSEETQLSPQVTIRTIHKLDDHADALELEIDFGLLLGKRQGVHLRKLYLHRFWALDDDGIYLVTFSTPSASGTPTKDTAATTTKQAAGAIVVPAPSGTGTVEYHPVQLDPKKRVYYRSPAPTVHAVLTVAPRADFAEYEFDVQDCTISCSVQVNGAKQAKWTEQETALFMDVFLRTYLTEVKHRLISEKYGFTEHGNVVQQMMISASSGGQGGSWSESVVGVTPVSSQPASFIHQTPPPPPPPPSMGTPLQAAPVGIASGGGGAEAVTELSLEDMDEAPSTPSPSSPKQLKKHSSFMLNKAPKGNPSPLPPPASPPLMRRANTTSMTRRGVTTVQPGMEDMQSTSPGQSHALDDLYADDHPAPKEKEKEKGEKVSRARRMLGLFSRTKTSTASSSADQQQSDLHRASSPLRGTHHREDSNGSNTASSSTPMTLTQTPSDSKRDRHLTREERRQRQKEFNTKLKRLRVRIEEKTCELKRVTETMREANRQGIVLGGGSTAGGISSGTSAGVLNPKDSDNNNNKGNAAERETSATTNARDKPDGGRAPSSYITAAQYVLLQGQQGELSKELSKLKGEYQTISGQSYDRSDDRGNGARRRGFGRFRGLRSRPVNDVDVFPLQDHDLLSFGTPSVSSTAAAHVYTRPWTATLIPPYWKHLSEEEKADIKATKAPWKFALRLLCSPSFWALVVRTLCDDQHPLLLLQTSSRRAKHTRDLLTAVHTLIVALVVVAALMVLQSTAGVRSEYFLHFFAK